MHKMNQKKPLTLATNHRHSVHLFQYFICLNWPNILNKQNIQIDQMLSHTYWPFAVECQEFAYICVIRSHAQHFQKVNHTPIARCRYRNLFGRHYRLFTLFSGRREWNKSMNSLSCRLAISEFTHITQSICLSHRQNGVRVDARNFQVHQTLINLNICKECMCILPICHGSMMDLKNCYDQAMGLLLFCVSVYLCVCGDEISWKWKSLEACVSNSFARISFCRAIHNTGHISQCIRKRRVPIKRFELVGANRSWHHEIHKLNIYSCIRAVYV